MADYVINDKANSFVIIKGNNSSPFSRNDLSITFSSDNDQIMKISDKSVNKRILFEINLGDDTVDVDGITVFADAQALYDEIEPIFFLINSGGVTSPVSTSWSVLLEAQSASMSQTPSGLDASLQIEFGVAQGTPNVDKVTIDVDGTLTFRDAQQYRILVETHAGRTGAGGTSLLLGYFTVNGVEVGNTIQFELDDANTNAYRSNILIADLPSGAEVKLFITRDPAFNNSGELLVETVTATGLSQSVTAEITVHELDTTGNAIAIGDDPNAVHVNVASEIAGIPEKVTLVDDDIILIEDSEDGFSKKRSKKSSLGGGGTINKGESTGVTGDLNGNTNYTHPVTVTGALLDDTCNGSVNKQFYDDLKASAQDISIIAAITALNTGETTFRIESFLSENTNRKTRIASF